jgi:hypothetical protein
LQAWRWAAIVVRVPDEPLEGSFAVMMRMAAERAGEYAQEHHIGGPSANVSPSTSIPSAHCPLLASMLHTSVRRSSIAISAARGTFSLTRCSGQLPGHAVPPRESEGLPRSIPSDQGGSHLTAPQTCGRRNSASLAGRVRFHLWQPREARTALARQLRLI